jgi:2-methylisocitrate lyase-like PEP mutase family enzyme
MSLADLAAAGAKRVSLGGALTWVAAAALVQAAERIWREGDFAGLAAEALPPEWLLPSDPGA